MTKSILEPLSIEELKANMKDTAFSDFYSEVQKLSNWIMISDIRHAKYGDITYKQLKKYIDHQNDTIYFKKKWEKWEDDYKKNHKSYDREFDSIMTYWNSYKELYNMDSIVKIEFSDIWKEYYSYSYGVKNVNIGFKITPLKNTIDQLTFIYEMKSKISNDGELSYTNSHRCLSSSPIKTAKTLYWEADYSDEKKLKDKNTEEVKRDYVFIIKLQNVLVDGVNYEDKLAVIPKYVQYEMETDIPGLWKDDIIKELISPIYVSSNEYCDSLFNEDCKKYNPLCYDLLNEYSKRND